MDISEIEKREDLITKREKIDKLYEKTKKLKGKQVRRLNQIAGKIIENYKEQIRQLEEKIKANEVELEKYHLGKEELQEERKQLLEAQTKVKEEIFQQEKEDELISQDEVFALLRKEINEIAKEISSDSSEEEMIRVSKRLNNQINLLIKQYPKYKNQIIQMCKTEEFSVRRKEQKVRNTQDINIKLLDILPIEKVEYIRGLYLQNAKEEVLSKLSDSQKGIMQKNLKRCEKEFEKYKKVMKRVSPETKVSPLRTEAEYKQITEEMLLEVDKAKSEKEIRKVIEKMNDIYQGLFLVTKYASTNEVRYNYEQIKAKLVATRTKQILPKDLPGKPIKKAKADFVQKVEVSAMPKSQDTNVEAREKGIKEETLEVQ